MKKYIQTALTEEEKNKFDKKCKMAAINKSEWIRQKIKDFINDCEVESFDNRKKM